MMKKKIGISILLVILVVGSGVMIGRNFFCKSFTGIKPIIFSCYNSNSDGYVNGGTIYLYNVEKKKRENIGNIALDKISYDGKNTLVGVQNLFPNSTGFRGIITYNISTQKIVEVLSCSRIYDMLDENNHTFTGNIQMNSTKDIFIFVCGKKMFMYNLNEEKLEELFDTSSNQYILSADGKYLYFSENGNLYLYDFKSKEKEVMIEGVYNFAISKDESTITYENQKEKSIHLYDLDTQENKEIIQLKHSGSQMYFSENNEYLLFTDYKGSIVPNNYKIEICIYDFAKNEISIIFKGKYEDNYRSVVW